MAATLLEVTPVLLTTALTTVYTVTANKTCNTVWLVLCNNNANSCNVTIHFVPAGGSNNATTFLWADSISGKKTIPLDFTIARAANSILQASASANNSVAMAITSLEK